MMTNPDIVEVTFASYFEALTHSVADWVNSCPTFIGENAWLRNPSEFLSTLVF